MPKTASKMRNNNQNRNGSHPITRGRVELVKQYSLSAGKYGIAVDQTITNITNTLSSIFRFYRFTHLTFELLPDSYTTPVVAQYVPGGGTTTSGAADTTQEGAKVIAISSSQSVPARMQLDRDDLLNFCDWFVTEGDPSDIYLESHGSIFIESVTATEVAFVRC